MKWKKKATSALVLVLFLTNMLYAASNVPVVDAVAIGTIYIRADGSVDPPTAPIQRNGDLYTLTDNIESAEGADGIIIERNNMTLDGAGHEIKGTISMYDPFIWGIILLGSNITIRSMKIRSFTIDGIGQGVSSLKGINIVGNNITGNGVGISLPSYSTISGNNITDNGVGIYLSKSSSSIISGNNITANDQGIRLYDSSSNNTIFGNNIIANGEIGILLNNSTRNTISGNNISEHSFAGVHLDNHADNNSISGNNTIINNWKGILLSGSSNYNSIFGNSNTIANNTIGIQSQYPSWYNSMSGNTVKANLLYGIFLNQSSYNSVSGNTITNNGDGINVSYAWNNTISRNRVTNNTNGIDIIYGEWNKVLENNVESNSGVGISVSTYPRLFMNPNFIYHNNLINNTSQANGIFLNLWDNGYLSGGNYWSDHNNTDIYNGPAQNEPGSDGIADTPYIINQFTSNIDNYPLANPFIVLIHDVAVTNVTPCKTIVGQGRSISLNVTVANQGDSTETFNVTLYANTTAITAPTNITLTSGNFTTLTFTWNTTDFAKGNYIISAIVTSVPGETDTTDNTFIYGWIIVTIPGDVDGDFDVDILDVVKITSRYGEIPPPIWPMPPTDIDCDGKITILDVVICTTHYGQRDP